MKTHATEAPRPARRPSLWGRLAVVTLLAAAFGPGSAAAASAKQCSGRYVVKEKSSLAYVIEVGGSTVRGLTDCKPVSPIRRILGTKTLRGTLDCSTGRSRVKLVFSADCQTLTAEIVGKGSLLRRIVAGLSSCGDGFVDADAGETCEPDTDPTCDPETCTPASGAPEGSIAIEIADNAPQITGFSPSHAEVGAQISILGTNFNRRRDGGFWSGTPPYRMYFEKQSPPFLVQATFTFVSATELRATVPAGARTGLVSLAEAVQGGVGSNYGWSPNDFVVDVPPPPPGAPTILHLTNNTQYNLVDLRVNGSQTIAAGGFVAPGGTFDVPFDQAGSVQIVAGIGFLDFSGAPDVWFQIGGQTSVSTGQTTNFTLRRITVASLLTNFGASADWLGEFYDDNFVPHAALLRFFPNGTYVLFQDGVQVQTGIMFEVSWPDLASDVTFQVGLEPDSTIAFPFGSFYLENGPASWPIIQYVLQN